MRQVKAQVPVFILIKITMAKKIFYSIFAAVGVGAMCVGLWLLTWGALSKGWPSTPGRIFSSHIASFYDKDGTTYGAAVTYEYFVNAQRYISDRVSFGDYSSSGSGHAHDVLTRYPADKIVTVYYNPLKPSMSVLEPGAGGGAFIPLGVGAAFVGFVLFMRMVEKENAELVAKAQAAKADAPVIFEPKEPGFPTAEKKRITVNRNSPRVLTNYPPSAIIMGLVFFAAGLGLAVFGVGAKEDGPLLVILGLFITAAGGSLAYFAYKGLRLRRMRDQAPGQSPWLYDNPWDRQAATDGGFKPFFRVLYAISMMSVFVATGQALMMHHAQGPGSVLAYIVFGLFDLGLLIGFGASAYLFLRAVKYGRNRIVFHSFPLQLGQDIAVGFVADKRLRNQALHAELQCIQEYYESSGSATSRTSSPVFEQLYSQKGEFRTDGRGIANLTFRLPLDARSTDLVGSPPCYWELEITAKVPGIDYRGIFLMPIYRAA